MNQKNNELEIEKKDAESEDKPIVGGFFDTMSAGISEFTNDIKAATPSALTGIMNSAFSQSNNMPGPLGSIFRSLGNILNSQVNSLARAFCGDAVIGKYMPGVIQTMAAPFFNLLATTQSAVLDTASGFIADTFIKPAADLIKPIIPGSMSDLISQGPSAKDWISGVLNPIADYYMNEAFIKIFGSKNSATHMSMFVNYAAAYNPAPPKMKNLFKIAMFINPPYSDAAPSYFYKYAMAVDLPSIDYQWEEVNMYGYHTKVFTGAKMHPINITFMDDGNNDMMDFWSLYRHAYIPITRAINDSTGLDPSVYPLFSTNIPDDGYNKPDSWYSSNISLLAENCTNLISHIMISHAYWADNWYSNQYVLVNPRFENFNLDKLEHDSSDFCRLNATVSYDTVFVNKSVVRGYMLYDSGDTDMFAYGIPGYNIPGLDRINTRNLFDIEGLNPFARSVREVEAGDKLMQSKIEAMRKLENTPNNLFRKR